MDKIEVIGNGPLKGEIIISGAKNSALKLMAASILTDGDLHLTNMPFLADITSMSKLLNDMGVKISLDGSAGYKGNTGRAMCFNAGGLNKTEASYDIVKTMRASAIVLGPLLAKHGHAKVSLPGGCAIDARPLNIHLSELEKLGVQIEIKEGYIEATAPNGLKGTEVDLIVPRFGIASVGATETLLMATSLAEGTSILKNAAKEPEIVDLCNCLIGMGAKIEGVGTDTITVTGVEKLHGYSHEIVADRIEAGTYAIAALITDGELELVGAIKHDLGDFIPLIEKIGAVVTETEKGIIVKRKADKQIKAVNFETAAFPGVATDLQAQITALLTIANGKSKVAELMYDNRFMHVPEMARMGAHISARHSVAEIYGTEKLIGCPVMATDLRASASLVLIGLIAEGSTVVDRVYHLDRGYEGIEEKLGAVGAKIRRVK
jgi:UDP-N-acetylglucosamine 1-carboxyvinyltransferase